MSELILSAAVLVRPGEDRAAEICLTKKDVRAALRRLCPQASQAELAACADAPDEIGPDVPLPAHPGVSFTLRYFPERHGMLPVPNWDEVLRPRHTHV